MPLLARHGPDLPLHWRGCEGQGHCEDPAQLRPGLRLVRGGGVSGPGSSSSYKGGQKMIPLLRPNVLHWAATLGEGDRFSYYDDDQYCGNDLHVWRWSHYAKRALTPRSLNVKMGPRRKGHKGWAVWLA